MITFKRFCETEVKNTDIVLGDGPVENTLYSLTNSVISKDEKIKLLFNICYNAIQEILDIFTENNRNIVEELLSKVHSSYDIHELYSITEDLVAYPSTFNNFAEANYNAVGSVNRFVYVLENIDRYYKNESEIFFCEIRHQAEICISCAKYAYVYFLMGDGQSSQELFDKHLIEANRRISSVIKNSFYHISPSQVDKHSIQDDVSVFIENPNVTSHDIFVLILKLQDEKQVVENFWQFLRTLNYGSSVPEIAKNIAEDDNAIDFLKQWLRYHLV